MDSPGPRPPVAARLTSRVFCAALVGAFSVGQAYDLITFQEHWPWSPYRMYATAKGDTQTVFEVWGVLANPRPGQPEEIKLKPHGYVLPTAAFKRAYGTGKPSGKRKAQAAMTEFINFYERIRRRKDVGNPPLKAVRLYKITHALRTDASTQPTKPDVREMVVEAYPTTGGRKGATRPATRPATQSSQPTTNATTPGAKP